MGVDGEALCRDAGLDPGRLRDPSERIEAHTMLALFALAETRSNDVLVDCTWQSRCFGGLTGYLVRCGLRWIVNWPKGLDARRCFPRCRAVSRR